MVQKAATGEIFTLYKLSTEPPSKDEKCPFKIKHGTFQVQLYGPVFSHKFPLLSQFLSVLSEQVSGKKWHKSLRRSGPGRKQDNPSGGGCSGRTAAGAQPQNCDEAFRLEDGYLDLRCGRREVEVNWLTGERSPPFRRWPPPALDESRVPSGRPLSSEMDGHVPQMERGGERGDPSTSSEFRMTERPKAPQYLGF